MKNSLWTFGCSFTAEYHPLNNDPPNTYDEYKKFKGGILPPVWPTLLSNKLDLNNKNCGIGAISNYKIFYQFCKNCSELQKNDIVIIGWTHPYRFLLAQNDNLQDILPSVSYPEFDSKILDYIFVNRSNDVWIQEILRFTQIINELCLEKNVKVFYWSFHDEIIKYITGSYKNCNLNQFIFGQNHETLWNTISDENPNMSTIKDESNGSIIDFHFGEYGHISQSNYFYKLIKDKL